MSKASRLGVVLLAVTAVSLWSNPRMAFGQQFKSSSSSNQSNKDKKDKDDDDKDRKDRGRDKKDKKEQGGSNNQGGSSNNGQNNNNNNNSGNVNNKGGNPSNSNNPVKSGTLNSTQLFKQFNPKNQNDNDRDNRNRRDDDDRDFRDRKDRHDDDHDHHNDGQGNINKIGPGFPNQTQNLQKTGSMANGPTVTKQFGTWKGDQWQGSHKVDNWSKAFGHKKPFSTEWYDDHPRAWKYDGRRSSVWVTATVPGVYSWLNWGSVPQQYQVGYNNGPRFDPSLYGEWYPLGVYSLMTGPDDVGTRVLQLAVDRRGRINGNYFDMITDSDHSVSGVIDRQTQRAEWSLNQNPNVQFRANIMRLLQPYGTITAQMPGGEQRWQFVRLEND